MADVEELIAEADKRGIGLMFDMVFNHVSTRHEWFRKAMEGDPYYKDFFIFRDRKSTRLNSSHVSISYAVFCLKKKKKQNTRISNERSSIHNRTETHNK